MAVFRRADELKEAIFVVVLPAILQVRSLGTYTNIPKSSLYIIIAYRNMNINNTLKKHIGIIFILSIFLLSGCGQPSTNNGWYSFAGGYKNQGKVSKEIPDAPIEVKWDEKVGDSWHESAVVLSVDSSIYMSVEEGIVKLDKDGNRMWGYKTNGEPVFTPSISSKGDLYFGTSEGVVYKINDKGEKVWQYSVGRTRVSPTTVHNDIVYFSTENGGFYAINSEGVKKWEFRLDGKGSVVPSVGDDGNVYAGTSKGFMYALDAQGNKKWKLKADGAINSPPTVWKSVVYFGTEDKSIYAVSERGKKKWDLEFDSKVQAGPVIGRDSSIYIGTNSGHVYSLSRDGERLWSHKSNSSISSIIFSSHDGSISFGTYNGELYRINDDGELNGSVKVTDNPITSAAVGFDDHIYVTDNSESLHMVGEITEPVLSVTNKETYFNSTNSSSKIFRDIQLKNSGRKELKGRVIIHNDNKLSLEGRDSFSLGSLESRKIRLSFTPDTIGYSEKDVKIVHNGEEDTTSINVIVNVNSNRSMLANSPWPLKHHDVSRRGASDYVSPHEPPELKWKAGPSSTYTYGISLSESGNVYFTNERDGIIKISKFGDVQWNYSDSINQPTILRSGSMYTYGLKRIRGFGSVEYKFYLQKLNGDGKVIWSVDVSGVDDGSFDTVIGKNGNVYSLTGKYLYSVNPRGKVQWKIANSSKYLSIDSDNKIYTAGTKLSSFNENKKLLWQTSLPGEAKSYIMNSTSGRLYLLTKDSILAYSDSGNKLFASNYDGEASSTPVLRDSSIYVKTDSTILSFDKNLNNNWKLSKGKRSHFSGLLLDSENNLITTRISIPEDAKSTPFGYSDTNSSLVKISNSGHIIWSKDISLNHLNGLTLSQDGDLYFSSGEGLAKFSN